jgi:hypothetical protein
VRFGQQYTGMPATMDYFSLVAQVRRMKEPVMKSHTEYLTFNVPARMGFENITPTIE